MRRSPSLAALFLLANAPGTLAFAQPSDPIPVEAWSLQKTATLGAAIYLQDRAAARATDALLARFNGKAPDGLAGWIVVEDGNRHLVRFLTGDRNNPTAAYDIIVDANGRAGAVRDASNPQLPAEQMARYQARLAAGSSFGPNDLRCSARYNSVILHDPDSDGWLVWLLSSTTDPNKIPMGGHYRFHITADGREITKRERLSTTCLDLDKAPPEAQTVGVITSITVAPQPLEVHVFLSLNYRMPIYTIANDRFWRVTGKRIDDVGPAPTR